MYKKNDQKVSQVGNDGHIDPCEIQWLLWPIPEVGPSRLLSQVTSLWWMETPPYSLFLGVLYALTPAYPYSCYSLCLLSSWSCQTCDHLSTSSFWVNISGSFWPTLISSLLKFLKHFLAVQYILPFTSIFNFAFIMSHFSDNSPQRQYHILNFVLSKTPRRME